MQLMPKFSLKCSNLAKCNLPTTICTMHDHLHQNTIQAMPKLSQYEINTKVEEESYIAKIPYYTISRDKKG